MGPDSWNSTMSSTLAPSNCLLASSQQQVGLAVCCLWCCYRQACHSQRNQQSSWLQLAMFVYCYSHLESGVCVCFWFCFIRICSCLRSIWLTKCFTNKLYMGITLFAAEMQSNNFSCGISRDRWDVVQYGMTLSIRLNRGGITTIFKAKHAFKCFELRFILCKYWTSGLSFKYK